MKRYKAVIRDEKTGVIIGYVEGNKSFYDIFGGETFYRIHGGSIVTFFYDYQGNREKLSFRQIDVSEMAIVILHKDLSIKRVVKNIYNPDRKRPVKEKPFIGVTYDKGMSRLKRWQATVKLEDGSIKFIGYYLTEQEAQAARRDYKG